MIFLRIIKLYKQVLIFRELRLLILLKIQKFYNYIFIYRRAMIVAREENSKLLKLMEAEQAK